MRLKWSADALDDLDRFAAFLHEKFPALAPLIARELIEKTRILQHHPELGRPLRGKPEFREIILRVLRAPYVIQYRLDGERIIILCVFHGREQRS